MTYLVLGSPDCKYCQDAKTYLDSHGQRYIYIDVTEWLGSDWRSKVRALQRTIPVIFRRPQGGEHNLNDLNDLNNLNNLSDLTGLMDAGWEHIGTYFDLIDMDMDMNMDMDMGGDVFLDADY